MGLYRLNYARMQSPTTAHPRARIQPLHIFEIIGPHSFGICLNQSHIIKVLATVRTPYFSASCFRPLVRIDSSEFFARRQPGLSIGRFKKTYLRVKEL